MSAEKKMSRRDLLKMAAAGGTGLVMSGLPVRVIAQAMGTSKVQTAGLDDNTLQPVADIQMARNPNVNVEWVVLTGIDHEEVAAKILALVAAGESIDVGYAATEACQLFAGQGLAAPLDDRITSDPDQDFWTDFFSDVHPSLTEAMMYEGSLYEPPRDFNAANMYFNTNVLAENGFEVPGEEWTKDDFLEIARGTTKKDDSGNTEVFGYAWTTPGDPPAGLFDIPETAEPDRRTFNAGTFGIQTSPPRAVENFLDMGHLPFVHSGLLGEQPFTEIVDYRVEHQDVEIHAIDCLIFQPMASAASVSGQMVNYTFRVPHPLCALLYKTTPVDEARLDVIGLFVHPLRAERIRAHLFNSLLDASNTDGQIRRFQQSVLAQDKPILENQVPKRLPLDPDAEVPARSDRTSNAYRRWLGELGLTYGVIPQR